VIFEPIIKEGHTSWAVLEMYEPELYIGFDYRRYNLELAAVALGVKPGECTEGSASYTPLRYAAQCPALRR